MKQNRFRFYKTFFGIFATSSIALFFAFGDAISFPDRTSSSDPDRVAANLGRPTTSSRTPSFQNAIQNPSEAAFQFNIDLNSADWTTFILLPGIGEVLAKRIVEYRQNNGCFQATDEICDVQGIGEKKFQTIAPFVVCSRRDDVR